MGSGIGGSDGGPGGLRGSDGGISDSDGESILVAEPWLGRWSWSLGAESRKSIAGTGGSREAKLVLVPKNYPYAHLKHLDVRAIGVGTQ